MFDFVFCLIFIAIVWTRLADAPIAIAEVEVLRSVQFFIAKVFSLNYLQLVLWSPVKNNHNC